MGPFRQGVGGFPCPGCRREVTVYWIKRLSDPVLLFNCCDCRTGALRLDPVEGLPSDTTALAERWDELAGTAYRRLRRRQKRAWRLLAEHLDDVQRREVESEGRFRLLPRGLQGIGYEITISPPVVTAHVPPGLEEKDLPCGRPPRRGRIDTARPVPLCLIVDGELSDADKALALKLFVESDERHAWVKGTRALLGLPPEPLGAAAGA